MAEDSGISKSAASAAFQSFMEGLANGLKGKDAKVTLTGFGTFANVHRKARMGRNPQTGEDMKIKARNVVRFKPGKSLKDAIA